MFCVCVFYFIIEFWILIINIWSVKIIVFVLIKKIMCFISEFNDVIVVILLLKRKVIIVFGMVLIWEMVLV